PLRLGEFVRPVMISRSGVPFAGAMASVVVERVADGVFNLGLFFFLLKNLPENAPVPADLRFYATIALVLFGGGLITLVLITLMQRPAFALIRRFVRPLAPGLVDRVLNLLDAFVEGLRALKSAGRLASFFVLTAAFWLINGFATWMLALTYIPDLPILAGPFCTSVVVFAIMIPAGPAFAGTLEAGFKFGLAPYGVAAEPAGALALANHAIQLVMMAVLAGVGFMAAEPGQTQRREKNEDAPAGADPLSRTVASPIRDDVA
ncbi:MAG: lysylphosphatidylglycerol synthase transmembrane domain-containing protein, partial [Myxococcota bacterium]